jgi:dihydrofolate reductase
MRRSALVAMAKNRVIGRDNTLPWRLSADLQRFKRLTLGHTLVMGRKTYESIGRPLPGRRMVVITRQKDFRPEGVQVVHSLEEALAAAPADEQELFIGGGEQIYRQALPLTDRLYLTVIERDVEGDAHFPELDPSDWEQVEEEAHLGAEEPLPYRFLTYDRRR